MITLHGYPNTRSIRAAWALEEAGAEYQYIKVDLAKGGGKSPEFRQLNPGGKIPVLVDGDFVLSESAAICAYIGDRFPESRLTPPAGSRERAKFDQWCYFAIGELEQPMWTQAKHRFALPEAWRVPAVIDTAAKEFMMACGVLDAGLDDRPYILGDGFTAADILIAHTLGWAKKFGHPPESETVAAYMERVLSRPALARARLREAA